MFFVKPEILEVRLECSAYAVHLRCTGGPRAGLHEPATGLTTPKVRSSVTSMGIGGICICMCSSCRALRLRAAHVLFSTGISCATPNGHAVDCSGTSATLQFPQASQKAGSELTICHRNRHRIVLVLLGGRNWAKTSALLIYVL